MWQSCCKICCTLSAASQCSAAGDLYLLSRLQLRQASRAVMLSASFPFLTLAPPVSHLGAAFPVFPSLGHGSCALPLSCPLLAAVSLRRHGWRWLLSQLPPGLLQPLVKALVGLRWVLVSLPSPSQVNNSSSSSQSLLQVWLTRSPC